MAFDYKKEYKEFNVGDLIRDNNTALTDKHKFFEFAEGKIIINLWK